MLASLKRRRYRPSHPCCNRRFELGVGGRPSLVIYPLGLLPASMGLHQLPDAAFADFPRREAEGAAYLVEVREPELSSGEGSLSPFGSPAGSSSSGAPTRAAARMAVAEAIRRFTRFWLARTTG